MWDAYAELLQRGQARRAHLRAVVRGHDARIRARRARADPGAAAAAALLGRWPAALLRREDLHGRQRRRPHGLALQGLEQELHGHRRGQHAATRRSIRRSIGSRCGCSTKPACTSAPTPSAIAPSTGWSTPMRQVLAEKPTPGLRHSIIHANIPSDHALETHGAAAEEIRCRHIRKRRRLSCGGSAIPTPAISGPSARSAWCRSRAFSTGASVWGGGSDYPVTPLAGALRPVGIGRARDA